VTFKEEVDDLAKRAIAAQSVAQTEEATKNAVILPFLRCLGFDVFDPSQVIPEYIADIGLKKGEKIDYAVKIGDKIEYLVECKAISTSLRNAQFSQLFRYFHTLDAKIAILTNGLEFWFFSDIDAPNRMDENPFFRFDLLAYDESDLHELERFHKKHFNIAGIRQAASSLKYLKSAMAFIKSQWDSPDEAFVRMVAKSFYESHVTASVVENLTPIVKRAFDDLFRQRVRARINVALNEETSSTDAGDSEQTAQEIETTEEELQGFLIVRAIAAEAAPVDRIAARDARSYFAVLFDDNNRKPVARLHFNGRTKFVTLFDAEKNETRHDIARLEDIYKCAPQIRAVVRHYVDAGT